MQRTSAVFSGNFENLAAILKGFWDWGTFGERIKHYRDTSAEMDRLKQAIEAASLEVQDAKAHYEETPDEVDAHAAGDEIERRMSSPDNS